MKKRNSYRGTSLLEVSVVVGIMSIIIVGAASFLIFSFRNQTILNDQLLGQKEARRIILEIVNTARTAETSSIGAFPISEASTSSLTFYANIDKDVLRERIHYWVQGTELKRGVLKPSGNPLSYVGSEQVTVLAHNVENIVKGIATFEYFDESYTGTGPSLSSPIFIPDITMVRIVLQIERDMNKSPVPLRVESLTHIRNLKTN